MFKLINIINIENEINNGCLFCDELCDAYNENGCAPFDLCNFFEMLE